MTEKEEEKQQQILPIRLQKSFNLEFTAEVYMKY
jgi:hypothetical protein